MALVPLQGGATSVGHVWAQGQGFLQGHKGEEDKNVSLLNWKLQHTTVLTHCLRSLPSL